jgi:hypothetical protein
MAGKSIFRRQLPKRNSQSAVELEAKDRVAIFPRRKKKQKKRQKGGKRQDCHVAKNEKGQI